MLVQTHDAHDRSGLDVSSLTFPILSDGSAQQMARTQKRHRRCRSVSPGLEIVSSDQRLGV